MKRTSILLAIAALTLSGIGAFADQAMNMKKSPTKTVTGELVDTGCYLSHGARGAKHVDCATKCIANGMPMGLLTSGGVLYLITLNHDNADPYNQLKGMAGQTVSVTGTMMTRNGMKGIDVTEVKPAAVPAAAK